MGWGKIGEKETETQKKRQRDKRLIEMTKTVCRCHLLHHLAWTASWAREIDSCKKRKKQKERSVYF